MPYVLNNPEDFVDEAIEGFVAAHSHLVRRVQGGVVRNQEKTKGQVAVVIGGGSGHYPAFAGIVGPGLAHGAVVGNVFLHHRHSAYTLSVKLRRQAAEFC